MSLAEPEGKPRTRPRGVLKRRVGSPSHCLTSYTHLAGFFSRRELLLGLSA